MKFMDQISSVKGFQQQWCGTGSKKLQHTAALEHAESMSHKKTFDLCLKGLGLNIQKRTKKEQLLLSSTGQQSIIHCINVMNGKDFRQTKKKFQIVYFLAEKEAPLSSFRKLISHKERHSVVVGTAYRNRTLGTLFLEYIVENLRKGLEEKLTARNFYSL